MSDSPRTAEKIAHSRAFLMMSSAEHTSMAMKQDKAWEKGLTIYEDKKKYVRSFGGDGEFTASNVLQFIADVRAGVLRASCCGGASERCLTLGVGDI